MSWLRPWSDWEVETLVLMTRDGHRAPQIAEALHRTESEVWGKALSLSVSPSTLLDEVASFMAAHGVPAFWFGLLAAGDEKLVQKIRAGRFTEETEIKVRRWMCACNAGQVSIPPVPKARPRGLAA